MSTYVMVIVVVGLQALDLITNCVIYSSIYDYPMQLETKPLSHLV